MNESIIINNLTPVMTNCQLTALNESAMDNVAKMLDHFNSLDDYPFIVISDAAEIKKNHQVSYLILLSITFITKPIRSPQDESRFSEYELLGLAMLKKDYGRVLIRPETIADKINDLFQSTDIDFDFNKAFSKKYYVVATDESKLRDCISNSFLETVAAFNELEIEVDGSLLMVRLRKPFTQENGELIANFITAINDGFN